MRWYIVPCVTAAVVLIGLGGFLLSRYGQSRYDAGYADARAQHAVNQAQEVEKAKINLDEAIHESNSKTIDNIDRGLVSLGIMRRQDDR